MITRLGIMTCSFTKCKPFPERGFYQFLTKLGKSENIDVFVFFPENVNWATNTIKGYQYDGNTWHKKSFPLPHLIYDRCFYTPNYYRATKSIVQRLKEHPKIRFLNHGFPGKWHIFGILNEDERSKGYLPPQEKYQSKEQLQQWLNRYKSIILKPVLGSHGKGVIRVEQRQGYLLEGRNFNNQYFQKHLADFSELLKELNPFIGKKRYLIQQYLHLNTENGHPFDIRIFVQKDRNGVWRIVGKGVRVGPKGKLTSNLDGGGKAVPFEQFLQERDPAFQKTIEQRLEEIGTIVPTIIESRFKPLFELGIDVGIDQQGKPWILEVNSKPGRDIFKLMGDEQKKVQVHAGPIFYARYLLEND